MVTLAQAIPAMPVRDAARAAFHRGVAVGDIDLGTLGEDGNLVTIVRRASA